MRVRSKSIYAGIIALALGVATINQDAAKAEVVKRGASPTQSELAELEARLCSLILSPVIHRKRIEIDTGEYKAGLRSRGNGYWQWTKKSSLTGPEGVLRIGFWGTGAAFAANQFQSNLLLIKGKTTVWIDLGSKTTIKMGEFQVGVNDIEHMILTHSHADHVGSVEESALKALYQKPFVRAGQEHKPGSPEFFQRAAELKSSGATRPNLYVPRHYAQVLWDQTLKGGLAYSEVIGEGNMQLHHYFNVVNPEKIFTYPRDSWRMTVGNGPDAIDITLFVVPHVPSNVHTGTLDASFFTAGLLIDGRVLISGDTRYDPNLFLDLAAALPGVDTIFHDAQSFPEGVHAYIKNLLRLPPHLRSQMLLYHSDDALRPLMPNGELGGNDEVMRQGFAGFAEALPVMYEWAPSQLPVKLSHPF